MADSVTDAPRLPSSREDPVLWELVGTLMRGSSAAECYDGIHAYAARIRAEALEEAAKVADDWHYSHDDGSLVVTVWGFEPLGRAIRALIENEKVEG